MVTVYTDGSCLNNQNKFNRKGGYGVFFGDNDPRNKSIKLIGDKITNQVAEITACICAIETLININITNDIIIKTDSMYTINCITKWFEGWKKKGWKKANGDSVENLDLLIKLYDYTKKYNVKYVHVRAHKDAPSKDDKSYEDWYGNMMADKLATDASLL